jgi:hypothetical protein
VTINIRPTQPLLKALTQLKNATIDRRKHCDQPVANRLVVLDDEVLDDSVTKVIPVAVIGTEGEFFICFVDTFEPTVRITSVRPPLTRVIDSLS